MTTIGIDPSINSTGVCIRKDKKCEYYIVTSKMTKKMSSFSHPHVHLIKYEKFDTKGLEYSKKETFKTQNLINIISSLKTILKKYSGKAEARMEGISYGSTGSAALIDLAGLNFAIRLLLSDLHIPFTIVSPTSLKLSATGNAGAKKEEMIWGWTLLEPQMKDIKDIKIDDLADAYWLSKLEPEKDK